MSWFARIEESCAAFIERAFAKTFPSDLEPAQIARKLVATMEARTQRVEGVLRAPGTYVVCVSDADYERLCRHRAYLTHEWSALLADMAARVGIALDPPSPSVSLDRRPAIVSGAVEIVAREGASYVLSMLRGVPPDGRYAIGDGLRIGRGEGCDLVLPDPSVSRAHAVIEWDGDALVLHDLQSTNGTFVNGERVQSRRLRPGDVVSFGKTQMRLESDS